MNPINVTLARAFSGKNDEDIMVGTCLIIDGVPQSSAENCRCHDSDEFGVLESSVKAFAKIFEVEVHDLVIEIEEDRIWNWGSEIKRLTEEGKISLD